MKKLQKTFLKTLPLWAAMILVLFLPSAMAGCSQKEPEQIAAADTVQVPIPSGTAAEQNTSKEKQEMPAEEASNSAEQEADGMTEHRLSREALLRYRPNELGQVMVLMYHQIAESESEWVRTPDNLKKDLLSLYERGYRLINLLDYARAEIDIEAGMSPVVLTFDDGTQGQFRYIEKEDGLVLDPGCAVAILEDFCAKYPDFGKGSTFYTYYPNPFRQEAHVKKKLNFLAENGYEIGNHTLSHSDLSRLSEEEVFKEIALHAQKTREIVPGYEVSSIALPYGIYPENRGLLLEGTYGDYAYQNEAVLLVGSHPAPSPFSIDFDPLAVPRIRASETLVENMGIYDWLDYFEKYPERRYISDGNRDTITAPQDQSQRLAPHLAGGRPSYFY